VRREERNCVEMTCEIESQVGDGNTKDRKLASLGGSLRGNAPKPLACNKQTAQNAADVTAYQVWASAGREAALAGSEPIA
jgi:hypothetical protein